jgi:hypothetical protein
VSSFALAEPRDEIAKVPKSILGCQRVKYWQVLIRNDLPWIRMTPDYANPVWPQIIVMQCFAISGRTSYGINSSRLRHDDSDDPSKYTK